MQHERWPSDPDAKSQIVAITVGTEDPIELRASAFQGTLRFELPASSGPLSLELFLYDETLDALGLVAGTLEPERGCERSCTLLQPKASYVARLDADGLSGGWTLAEPSARVSEALVADYTVRCDECVFHDLTTIPLPGPVIDTNTGFVAEGELESLVGLERGELYRLGLDLEVDSICLGDYTPGKMRDAFLRDGTLWMVDSFGVYELSVSEQIANTPCVVRTSTTPDAADPELRHVDGAPSPHPFQLYALSTNGELREFDGERWRVVATLDAAPGGSLSLLWLEPDRAAVTLGDDRIAFVNGDQVDIQRVPLTGAALRAQAVDPELGHVFVMRDQGLAFWQGASWRLEVSPPTGWLNAQSVIAHRGRWLYGLAGGRFGEWRPDRGYCPIQDGFGSEIVTEMARLGERIIFDRISDGSAFGPRVGAVEKPQSRCLAH